MCGERGLEQNSELQTFVINVPKSFKAYFDQITSELCQARMNCRETKGFEATTIKIDEISRVDIYIKSINVIKFRKNFVRTKYKIIQSANQIIT